MARLYDAPCRYLWKWHLFFFFYTEPFQLASETNIAGELKAHVGRKEGAGLKFIRKEDGCEETRKSE